MAIRRRVLAKFQCRVINEAVTLYLGEIEHDASGQRAFYGVNGCSDMKRCGVQTQSGKSQSFNWNRCPYVTPRIKPPSGARIYR